jgi:hypothetical protein
MLHQFALTDIGMQIVVLFTLGIPIACVAWTITHEEVFREPRDYCFRRSQHARSIAKRKFFYLFTCEYCFSHYVTIFFLILTRYKLLFSDWRGYLLAFFALVYVTNVYMSLFGRLRLDIKEAHLENKIVEVEAKKKECELDTDLSRAA